MHCRTIMPCLIRFRNVLKPISSLRGSSFLGSFTSQPLLLLLSAAKELTVKVIAHYGIPVTELRSLTCHMVSHGVTCHPTQVNAFCLNSNQIGRYSIYLPLRDGRLSWPRWLVMYWDGLPVCKLQPLDSDPTGSWTHNLFIVSPTYAPPVLVMNATTATVTRLCYYRY